MDPTPDNGGQESWTTYHYVFNNPVKLTDPDGRCPTCIPSLISWIAEGYYKYIQGGLDYAQNEVTHKTNNEYTAAVPKQVRDINYAMNKVKAIQTSVEGASQILQTNSLMIGVLEGGAIAATGSAIPAMVKPQGVSLSQFRELSKMLKDKVGNVGDDIFIQGSRATGTAKKKSDIDIGISVSNDQFNILVKKYFGSPNPGSAKEKTMLHALKTGKIQAGEAKLSQLRKQVEGFLGIETDISIIRQGSSFDKGAKLYVK